MTDHADIPEELYSELRQALELTDIREKARQLDGILAKLEAQPENAQSAESMYLQGYVLYTHPERRTSTQLQQETERRLAVSVVRAESQDAAASAWLYLGHHAYDLAQYEWAAARFDQVTHKAVTDYLWMKTVEMKFCTSVMLRGVGASLGHLEDLVRLAEVLPVHETMPQELARILPEATRKVDPQTRNRLLPLLERLDRRMGGNWLVELVRSREDLD